MKKKIVIAVSVVALLAVLALNTNQEQDFEASEMVTMDTDDEGSVSEAFANDSYEEPVVERDSNDPEDKIPSRTTGAVPSTGEVTEMESLYFEPTYSAQQQLEMAMEKRADQIAELMNKEATDKYGNLRYEDIQQLMVVAPEQSYDEVGERYHEASLAIQYSDHLSSEQKAELTDVLISTYASLELTPPKSMATPVDDGLFAETYDVEVSEN